MLSLAFVIFLGGGGWDLFDQGRQINSLWERFWHFVQKGNICFCVLMVIAIKIACFYQ